MKRLLAVLGLCGLVGAAVWWWAPRGDAVPTATLPQSEDPAPSLVRAVDKGIGVAPVATTGEVDRQSEIGEVRQSAEPQPIDWPERARASGAMADCGDVGVDALRAALRQSLSPADGPDPFAVPVPTVEELTKDLTINPTGRPLSPVDAAALADLLSEYGKRFRDARRDRHLASNLTMIDAVGKGDFVEKPNGSDPEGIWRKTMSAAEADFANNRADFNGAEIPGANFGNNRIIILRRDRYPEYFSAVDGERMLQGEFDLAVRSVFVASRTRR